MVAFKIIGIKDFMYKLLMEEVFDSFLLVSFEIVNYAKFTIDGVRNKEWYDEMEDEDFKYVSWKEVRNAAASLIKGKKIPIGIKAVFRLSKLNTAKIAGELGVEDATEKDYGMYFNLKFEKGELSIITGVSVVDFLRAKEIGNLWDEYLLKFLKNHQIAVEML